MAGPYDFTGQNIENTYQRVLQTPDGGATVYDGTGSLVTIGGGSTFPYTGSAIISGSLIITGSLNAPSITGSLLGTASWANSSSQAITASYALNGGVTQLLAGPNISLSPTTGLGQVTISSIGGGGFNTATGSYGSFYDTTTQTNVASTARSMSLNTTDISNGVSISGSTNPYNTYIKVENPGVYDIQFSAQVDKIDSGTDEIWIWLRKNGVDVADTATSLQLVGNGAHYVAAWNFFVNAAANDYFQLMWYSPDANVRLHAESSFGVVPGIPSLIVTVNRVDQFLSNTGSFTGSFTGQLIGTASWAQSASQALTASYTPNALITASVSSNVLTFTKGNGTTFNLTVATGSTVGGINTSILYKSASVIDGSSNLTYQYDSDGPSAGQINNTFIKNFSNDKFDTSFPGSFVINNSFDSDNTKQTVGITNYQTYLESNTGATTIFVFDANASDLSMLGFKCDYSLLLRDRNTNTNIASRIGTLMGAWNYNSDNPPILTDTYVDGDQVYNDLGDVLFTLRWNDINIELQMDCTRVNNGATYFNGLFTNFGTTL